MANPSSPSFTRPLASFIGATIEVADLPASTAFHRRWLPLLGFARIGADTDRVLWSRRDQHLMMREAAVDAATGGAILTLAAVDRAQVDALHAHLVSIGADVTAAPAEQPYVAPGHYGFAFRCPDGTRFEIAYRWDDLPEIEGVEHVRLPGDGVTLGGYLYKPEAGQPPHPALLLLHGFGRNAWTDRHLAELAANSGYKVLSLSLRGWLGSEGDNDQGGRQVDDAMAAIDWLRRLPSVDPDRVGVIGTSMGGQVALLAAARRPAIRCVAALFPPTDLPGWYEANPYVRPYLDDLADADGLTARSPINHADDIDVPVLMMHGDKDENVPLDQSLRMTEKLRGLGKEAELLIVSGASHFFSMRENTIARQRLFAFLRQSLVRR